MWLLYSFIAVFFKAGQNFAEKSSQNRLGSRLTALMVMVVSSLMLAPSVWGQSWPTLGVWFWPAILINCVIYLAAKPLRLYALGNGSISKTVPLLSTQVVFALILGYLFLGEVPTLYGLGGVGAIVAGSVVMTKRSEVFSRSTIFLFLSLMLGAVMSLFDKLAINNTQPRSPNLVIFLQTIISLPLFAIILPQKRINATKLMHFRNWKVPILIGFLYTGKNLFHFNAICSGYIAYVSAIGQLAMIPALWWGKRVYKEEINARLIIGVMGIIAGVTIISLWG